MDKVVLDSGPAHSRCSVKNCNCLSLEKAQALCKGTGKPLLPLGTEAATLLPVVHGCLPEWWNRKACRVCSLRSEDEIFVS